MHESSVSQTVTWAMCDRWGSCLSPQQTDTQTFHWWQCALKSASTQSRCIILVGTSATSLLHGRKYEQSFQMSGDSGLESDPVENKHLESLGILLWSWELRDTFWIRYWIYLHSCLSNPRAALHLSNINSTTSKPLTGDVNNTDHLITIRCSAGEPRALAFMWMPLDTHHPSKHCSEPSTPTHHNNTPKWPMAVAPYTVKQHEIVSSFKVSLFTQPWKQIVC